MAETAVTIPQPQSMRAAERSMAAERPVNVGDLERWLSLLGGGVLALYGLRRSLGTFVLLFGASALISRGLSGHCALYQKMDISTVSHNTHTDSTPEVAGAHDTSRIVVAYS
jgi:uncharacterized membrane protein